MAACPCAGTISETAYRAIVDGVVRGLTIEPELLLGPLAARMAALAAAQRFEEAADVRDRAAALSRALDRQRRLGSLVRAGRLTLELDGGGATVEAGRLVSAWGPAGPCATQQGALPFDGELAPAGPLPAHLADEVLCVAAWLEGSAGSARLTECEGELAWPLPRLRRFEAAGASR